MASILFVCTGNSCRSPMAEVLGRRWWGDLCEGLSMASAGLSAFAGAPASENARRAAAEGGEDLGTHRTRPLSGYLVDESDLILAMTRAQKVDVLRWHPQAKEKVFTLGEFAEAEVAEDVDDPWGEDVDSYRRTWSQIEKLIAAAAPRLRSWLSERELCSKDPGT